MPRVIRIHDVPDHLRCVLERRAAMAGKTLSDYLLEELARFADLPTTELVARIPRFGDVLEPSPAHVIRQGRGRR